MICSGSSGGLSWGGDKSGRHWRRTRPEKPNLVLSSSSSSSFALHCKTARGGGGIFLADVTNVLGSNIWLVVELAVVLDLVVMVMVMMFADLLWRWEDNEGSGGDKDDDNGDDDDEGKDDDGSGPTPHKTRATIFYGSMTQWKAADVVARLMSQ